MARHLVAIICNIGWRKTLSRRRATASEQLDSRLPEQGWTKLCPETREAGGVATFSGRDVASKESRIAFSDVAGPSRDVEHGGSRDGAEIFIREQQQQRQQQFSIERCASVLCT